MNPVGGQAVGDYLAQLFGLRGQVAVVVGGSSGLGAHAAMALAQCGAVVVVAGRHLDRCNDVVEAIERSGQQAHPQLVDVTDASSVEKLAEECFGRLERVDILINAAGVFTQTPTASLTLAEWRSVLDTNLTGTFISCQAFGLRMAAGQGGRIVNFASTDAFFGVPGEAAYCSSKGGVVQLTRALAVEWISANVRVNAVAPSDFVTPMLEPYLADEKYVARVRAGIPIGRFGQAEDIAGAVVFLSSHASAMVVGECLMVDGGRTAR